MNFAYPSARLAGCLLACLLLTAAGLQAQPGLPLQAAAADPHASVPPTRYQSALDYHAPAAPRTSPDRNWVASNDTVAAASSMALTMKPMAAHAGHAGAQARSDQGAAAPAAPAATAATPAHDHASMHHMDMNMDMNMDMHQPNRRKETP